MMGFPPPQQRTEAQNTVGYLDMFKTGMSPQVNKIQEIHLRPPTLCSAH